MMDQTKSLIFSVAGYSKSGKTTLVVDLIKALKKKGYTAATIKHSDKLISLDTEGKDTWRHKDAGAELAVLHTELETSILFKNPLEDKRLCDIVNYSANPDIIIVEGCKRAELPIIWVDSDQDCDDENIKKNIVFKYDGHFDKLIDFITRELEIHKFAAKLPQQDCGKCGFDTCKELVEHVLDGDKELTDCDVKPEEQRVELTSAGEPVKLNKFTANVIAGMLTGFAKELKDVKDINQLEIKIKRIK
jgi:molybdopterin-guanine dinucleotide biosynthesis protein B